MNAADVVRTVKLARTPVTARDREAAYVVACQVAALSLLDLIDEPGREDPVINALRGLLQSTGHGGLAVLLESVPAPQAHRIVDALAARRLVDPDSARVAHARIDMRPNP